MPTDRLFIPYIQVTRTLVYHRHNPPADLAFPEGVAGVIRATPGSTGTEMSSDHYNNGCVEHVTDRIRFQFNVTVQTLGYLDADARMAAHGNRHLLRDSTDDEEDIQALLRGEIQVCTDFLSVPSWEVYRSGSPTTTLVTYISAQGHGPRLLGGARHRAASPGAAGHAPALGDPAPALAHAHGTLQPMIN